MGWKETSRNNRYVYGLDSGDGFMSVHLSQTHWVVYVSMYSIFTCHAYLKCFYKLKKI